MLHPNYLEMTHQQKADFMARVIIIAESKRYHETIFFFVESVQGSDLFDTVRPGDVKSEQLKDLDNPIDHY